MKEAPEYFEDIRQHAERRWEQLEADPELAAPWWQLFKQVQNPRHVLSELLQNADDAGAKCASVTLDDGTFCFQHDGEDFAEDHFASLCRFGYSNKRVLHTIGFRGIGFKSTFSLGDCVELFTPSLSVGFNQKRFTLPEWYSDGLRPDGATLIRVHSVGRGPQRELQKNFQAWQESAMSLLFFRNIRELVFDAYSVRWRTSGRRPVPNGEWVALKDAPDCRHLHVRSTEEPFPEEALEEIRRERLLADTDEMNFPPCSVEIVLGDSGRLYVVLPTGVETDLPFACNAPFIQDPARLKIKDPETSPTNQWLLRRCGRLAAEAMLGWLGNVRLSLSERAEAYSLLPDAYASGGTLEDSAAGYVVEGFAEAIEGQAILLTENGYLVHANESLTIPGEFLEVWPAESLMSFIDEQKRPPLCTSVQDEHRQRLVDWQIAEAFSTFDFLQILRKKRPPKPGTWQQLLSLWAILAPELTGYNAKDVEVDGLNLVPVRGKRTLFSAREVVRLGEGRVLQSGEDWEFLSPYLNVLHPDWMKFLDKLRMQREERGTDSENELVHLALSLLEELGFDNASDVDDILATVVVQVLAEQEPDAKLVRLTHIAAKLRATVPDSFQYRTRTGEWRTCEELGEHPILVDNDGNLELLLPEDMRDDLLLHQDYTRHFKSCSKAEWTRWSISGRSRLDTFVPLKRVRFKIASVEELKKDLGAKGYSGDLERAGARPAYFFIDDWDFAETYWEHWEGLGEDRSWAEIVERLLMLWSNKSAAKAGERSLGGKERIFRIQGLTPNWVLGFEDKSCLPDTRGFLHPPSGLMRRTPETEALLDVEPFIDGNFDTEANRDLLDLLGVQSAPVGPEKLLERLRILSLAENAPAHEVEKWYRRLDQMLYACNSEDAVTIKDTFRSEKLILATDGSWNDSTGVFVYADPEDVPGAAVIRPAVQDLALWAKVGVADRPTVELAIEWLQGLPSGEKLPPDDVRRVRNILARHPVRLFEACQHWLSLAGTWVPVDELRHAMTMQSLMPWEHLHAGVKNQTADLRTLLTEIAADPPFNILPLLSSVVVERFSDPPRAAGLEAKPWMQTFGTELARIELKAEDDETARIRALAERVGRTRWSSTDQVEITPYIDGVPVGTARCVDVAWVDEILYVGTLSKAKLAKRVPEELAKVFGRQDIREALHYSYERDPEDVREYLEANFPLAERTVDEPIDKDQRFSIDDDQGESQENSDQGEPDTWEEHEASETGAVRTFEVEPRTQGSSSEEDHPVPPPPKKPAPPSLFERFASAQGYQKVKPNHFVRQDGCFINKDQTTPFPWMHHDVNGKIICWYWAKDHCLERDPLEVPAEVWGAIKKYPDTHSLVLSNIHDEPREWTGADLVALCQQGSVTLHPATYRVVHSREGNRI